VVLSVIWLYCVCLRSGSIHLFTTYKAQNYIIEYQINQCIIGQKTIQLELEKTLIASILRANFDLCSCVKIMADADSLLLEHHFNLQVCLIQDKHELKLGKSGESC